MNMPPFDKIMDELGKGFGHIWDPNDGFGILFYGIVFLVAASFVSRIIRLAAARILQRQDDNLVDPTVVLFLTQFAQVGVYVVGLIIFFHIIPALNKLGTALLTGVSVMSVVFGLAAQNTLSNLVAGCTLLMYRPFHIDDVIQVATPTGTESGVVERLTLGYTMLRTLDDRLVVVPNSLMASQVSLNLNRKSLHAMAIVPIGVADLAHLREVRTALVTAAQANKKIRRIIGYNTQILDDQEAILTLRAWCANTEVVKQVQEEVSAAIEKQFTGKNYVFMMSVADAAPLVPVKAE